MAFDPDQLIARPPIETRQQLEPAAVILYALGVGARDLQYVYEQGLRALPTMAAAMAYPGFVWRDYDLGVDWRRVLHGETSITLAAPLPVQGELIGRTRFGPIFDKGAQKGAVAYQTREIHTADGVHVATVRNGSFLRSEGGFGGSSEGQPQPHRIPDREPDVTVQMATTSDQALIYRLSGDLNPLHIDPQVAQAAGFPRPILHGLASYGVAGRALLQALCENEPERLKRLDVRFASPLFPGETLRIAIWREGDGRAAFRATVEERGQVILNNGYAEFA
ncbi:MaoC/PaaZ C-terminal domain-containing protein [Phenylobacterium sp. LjRoot219]|uniref:MaoC family dehydratase n=1 Tax=Phenylobacterium sp. LjRoot219 TaxID=3342283 RepID=UPI003ED0CBD7